MSTKEALVSFKDFEQSRLSFEKNEPKVGDKQLRWNVHYDHPVKGKKQQLLLQFPWQKIFSYGVPTLGEYFKTDEDRAFLKFPIDLENKEMLTLYNELLELDKRMESLEVRTELFDNKKGKYVYVPICKTPTVEEDYNGPEKPKFMKLKIALSYPEGNVVTKVYKSELVKNENGESTRKREPVEINTVTEFAETVKYMSNVRLIIRPAKVWAQKATQKDPNYGITFKIFKVEVDKQNNSMSLQQYMDDTFLDSDEENNNEDSDEVQPMVQSKPMVQSIPTVVPQVTKSVTQSVAQSVANESDASENESDHSDDSEEAPPSPVVKRGTRVTRQTKKKPM